MILVLIGMSGAGKTTWAERLAAHGFTWIHCDDLITLRLRNRYGMALRETAEQGAWLGLPHTPGYAEREQLFLRCEAELLYELADSLDSSAGPLVIDTGGSAIYAGEELFVRFRRQAHIIYLAIPAEAHRQMLENYLARPKPLIWHGLFKPLPGEDLSTTYERCYPELIRAREQLYEAYCTLRLPGSVHHPHTLTVPELLSSLDGLGHSPMTPDQPHE